MPQRDKEYKPPWNGSCLWPSGNKRCAKRAWKNYHREPQHCSISAVCATYIFSVDFSIWLFSKYSKHFCCSVSTVAATTSGVVPFWSCEVLGQTWNCSQYNLFSRERDPARQFFSEGTTRYFCLSNRLRWSARWLEQWRRANRKDRWKYSCSLVHWQWEPKTAHDTRHVTLETICWLLMLVY